MTSQERSLDLVVFGATGFTGRLCCEYIARRYGDTISWAVAGRSKSKLDDLVASLTEVKGSVPQVIIADSMDEEAIDLMCSRTRVVLAMAGPYTKYGSLVVASCAKHGTHYCDITGETMWVKEMMEKHGELAKKTKAILVPMCGYDSVPSDMGAFFVATHLKDKLGKQCGMTKCLVGPIEGGVSGGTLASVLVILGEFFAAPLKLLRSATDPYYLLDRSEKRGKDRGVATMWPSIDVRGRACTCMSPLGLGNTQVVRRSAAALGYGPDFSYDEVLSFGSSVFGPVIALCATVMLTMAPLMLVPPFRWLVPKPGTGPSAEMRKGGSIPFVDQHMKGFWVHRVWAVASGDGGEVVHGFVSGDEDPGYGSTHMMCAEAAMALVLDTKRLPGAASGGLMTPAMAFGAVLIERLEKHAGLTFEMLPAAQASARAVKTSRGLTWCW